MNTVLGQSSERLENVVKAAFGATAGTLNIISDAVAYPLHLVLFVATPELREPMKKGGLLTLKESTRRTTKIYQYSKEHFQQFLDPSHDIPEEYQFLSRLI
ncbi:MAG: hypothetical protein ABIH34_06125 [Nanoarchaeota archaeon]